MGADRRKKNGTTVTIFFLLAGDFILSRFNTGEK